MDCRSRFGSFNLRKVGPAIQTAIGHINLKVRSEKTSQAEQTDGQPETLIELRPRPFEKRGSPRKGAMGAYSRPCSQSNRLTGVQDYRSIIRAPTFQVLSIAPITPNPRGTPDISEKSASAREKEIRLCEATPPHRHDCRTDLDVHIRIMLTSAFS